MINLSTSRVPTEPSELKSRGARGHDILWGQPVFRAPPLPNPRVPADPGAFQAPLPGFQGTQANRALRSA